MTRVDQLHWLDVAKDMKKTCGMGMSVQVFMLHKDPLKCYLGIRYHDLGGTDYQYEHKIEYHVAVYLVENGINDFMGNVREYKASQIDVC